MPFFVATPFSCLVIARRNDEATVRVSFLRAVATLRSQ